MEKQFWLKKWEDNIIGFHKESPNQLLVNFIQNLELTPNARVLIPLCGKSLDIEYLISKDYQVVGIELSEKAIIQLFQELNIIPKIKKLEKVIHYSTKNLDIFIGDIFDITIQMLGPIDAIYDRAALIALPIEMRINYTKHLVEISKNAPQLVITVEYNQDTVAGPPFSISTNELNDHYASFYRLECLESLSIPGGLKGKYKAQENVWLLN